MGAQQCIIKYMPTSAVNLPNTSNRQIKTEEKQTAPTRRDGELFQNM